MRTVVIDVEANGLHPTVSHIHCICVLDCSTQNICTFTQPQHLIEESKSWDVVVGHGILSYDLFTILKCWNIPFTVGPDTFNGRPVQYIDTLVWARYLNPDRPAHGLEYFGELLKFRKTDWKDFSEFSEEMEAYCINDCMLTQKTLRYLEQEKAR